MKSFDLKTHHRDAKTGQITKVTPYTLKIDRDGREIFIRDGVKYFSNGEQVDPNQKPVVKRTPEEVKKSLEERLAALEDHQKRLDAKEKEINEKLKALSEKEAEIENQSVVVEDVNTQGSEEVSDQEHENIDNSGSDDEDVIEQPSEEKPFNPLG